MPKALGNYHAVDTSFLDDAPLVLTTRRRLRSSGDAVWATLLDSEAWVRWNEPIAACRWTSQPLTLGVTRTVELRTGDRIDEEFMIWEEGVSMGFRVTASTSSVFDALAEEYRIERHPDGSSELVWRFAASPRGVWRPIFSLLRLPAARYFRKLAGRLDREAARHRRS